MHECHQQQINSNDMLGDNWADPHRKKRFNYFMRAFAISPTNIETVQRKSNWLRGVCWSMDCNINKSKDSLPCEYLNTLCMVTHHLTGYKEETIQILASGVTQLEVLKGSLDIRALKFSSVKQGVQTVAS